MESLNPRHEDRVAELPELSALPQHDSLPSVNEKKIDTGSDSIEVADEKYVTGDYEGNEEPEYRNGEPIITTGRDVSRFAVDLRDDGDEALTFRSLVLGTVVTGLGAALCQVSPHLS